MALKSKQEREQRLNQAAQTRESYKTAYNRPYNPYNVSRARKGSHNLQDRVYKNVYSNAARYAKQITYLAAIVHQYPTGPLRDGQQALLSQRKQQLSAALTTLRSLHVDVVNTEWFKKASNLI